MTAYKVGDLVSLERWDAFQRPDRKLGVCRITKLEPFRNSQSGTIADVRNEKTGRGETGLDIAWLKILSPMELAYRDD